MFQSLIQLPLFVAVGAAQNATFFLIYIELIRRIAGIVANICLDFNRHHCGGFFIEVRK